MTVLYKNTDRCTDLILDFIAGGDRDMPPGSITHGWLGADGKRHPMESGGNYNAVIGHATHATEDFSRYTIASVYVKQRVLALSEPSSAIGRYQFVRATLQSLCEQARIPTTTLFTPELQDRLAWLLLCRRGYRNWWVESSPMRADQTFAHALSMEWASLPDPMNGGKSHYDGVGPNHAGCSLADVYAMLKEARLLALTRQTTISTRSE